MIAILDRTRRNQHVSSNLRSHARRIRYRTLQPPRRCPLPFLFPFYASRPSNSRCSRSSNRTFLSPRPRPDQSSKEWSPQQHVRSTRTQANTRRSASSDTKSFDIPRVDSRQFCSFFPETTIPFFFSNLATAYSVLATNY